jgi:hypothetical protein
LDFAKAFDTIEHYVILEMLEKLNKKELSPLLFVLAVEVLQYIINGLKDKGILKLPILQPTSDFSHRVVCR